MNCIIRRIIMPEEKFNEMDVDAGFCKEF